ncbi:MAG: cytochrome c oxidase subunit II [Alphaproteobacteria bacterium]
MRLKRLNPIALLGGLMALISSVVFTSSAMADARQDWGLGLLEAASPVMEQIIEFHNLLLVIIVAITLLVLFLLLFVMFRFRESANPEPSKTSHNTLIEILWTAIPILILVVIAIPSFRLLYYEETIPEDVDMTIKATGHQWYWTYTYPDHGNFEFDSIMLEDDELPEGGLRLLEVDNQIVVPVNAKVRVLVTADDVIHNWAMPEFGNKTDAVPGRVNETWFQATRTGSFYGQCSELCGVRHAFMPIRVDVVTQEEFDAWVAQAKEEFASADRTNFNVATIAAD